MASNLMPGLETTTGYSGPRREDNTIVAVGGRVGLTTSRARGLYIRSYISLCQIRNERKLRYQSSDRRRGRWGRDLLGDDRLEWVGL